MDLPLQASLSYVVRMRFSKFVTPRRLKLRAICDLFDRIYEFNHADVDLFVSVTFNPSTMIEFTADLLVVHPMIPHLLHGEV